MSEPEKEPIGEVLGEIPCFDCGGVAYVKRTKRRGNHYMSSCPNCGIDQKTGPAQKRMSGYVPIGSLKTKPIGQVIDKSVNEIEIKPDLTGSKSKEVEPTKPAAKPRKYGLLAVVGVVALAALGLAS